MPTLTRFGQEVSRALSYEFLIRQLTFKLVMGFSSDYMPYVGDVPDKPGQMVLAGFSGHGMPLILLSAKAMVQMLRHGKSFEDTGVPAPFRVTKQRLESTKNDIIDGHEAEQRASKL